jgi:hypothetical protein
VTQRPCNCGVFREFVRINPVGLVNRQTVTTSYGVRWEQRYF